MKKLFISNKDNFILLFFILIGSILGFIFKEDALVVKPLGNLFLNLLLVCIVPLIFISVSLSISKIRKPKRVKKILFSTLIVFIITSVIAVLFTFLVLKNISLVESNDISKIKETFNYDITEVKESNNFLDKTINIISVNDFNNLLSNDNIIALLLISIIVGFAIKMNKNNKQLILLLESLNETILNYLKIIMRYAPIGLGCYFASIVGTLGKSIAFGYAKMFILYIVIALLFYFLIYSIYAFVAYGKEGIKIFWKNIIPVTLTSLGTCSSAASLPTNIKATKNMNVSDDVCNTVLPLGVTFHKDGSNIGSVFKIMFLIALFGTNISSFSSSIEVITIALVSTLLVSAVPLGGGTISETLIITSLGYPIACLPILTVIAAIIDAPATMLNVVGDTSSALLINKLSDSKIKLRNLDIKKRN